MIQSLQSGNERLGEGWELYTLGIVTISLIIYIIRKQIDNSEKNKKFIEMIQTLQSGNEIFCEEFISLI